MNIEELKQYLESNKDNQDVLGVVKQFAPKQEIGLDEVKQLTETNENVKKWFESERDKFFSSSLTTWKSNNLEKLLDEEVRRRFPQKDEKDIELEKIKAELAKIQQEKQYETLKSKALSVASDKKIPTSLIPYFIGDDEESTVKNLVAFESVMETYVKTQVDERLKGSYQPPNNNNNFNSKNPWKKETFNLTEQANILKENPELAKQLIAQAK